MAYKAIKTEHSGSKKGRGAYWGPKRDAKKESNKLRRRYSQREIVKASQSIRDEIWNERYRDTINGSTR